MKITLILVIALIVSCFTQAQLNIETGMNSFLAKIEFYESNYSILFNPSVGLSYDNNKFGIQTNINFGSVPLKYSYSQTKINIDAKIRIISLSVNPELNIKDFYIGPGLSLYKTLGLKYDIPEAAYKTLETQLESFIYSYQLSAGYKHKYFRIAIFYEKSINKYFVIPGSKHTMIGIKLSGRINLKPGQ